MSLYVLSHITAWTQGRPLLPALHNTDSFLTIPLTTSTGSHFTCLESWSNQSQHKTIGALVHSNSSVIQLLLYDIIITMLANRALSEGITHAYMYVVEVSCYATSLNTMFTSVPIKLLWVCGAIQLHECCCVYVTCAYPRWLVAWWISYFIATMLSPI